MAEKKKYNSILISGRKDQTLTYSKYVKDEESGESVKESLDKKVNITDELTTQQIKDGAITNEKMAADSVDNTNLQDGSVSNEKLEDGSITNEKLAENSITKDKLKDNTIGVEKLDPELRQTINAATGLTKDLVETIQNVDDTLKDHQSQLDDKQSQIDDKQQQITANDEDISLLQTRSTQMEETIKSIAATGGASQATAVTYDNANSQLTATNIQSAVDELQGSKIDKSSILQESGEAEDKVMSQKAVSDKLSDLSNFYDKDNIELYRNTTPIAASQIVDGYLIGYNLVPKEQNNWQYAYYPVEEGKTYLIKGTVIGWWTANICTASDIGTFTKAIVTTKENNSIRVEMALTIETGIKYVVFSYYVSSKVFLFEKDNTSTESRLDKHDSEILKKADKSYVDAELGKKFDKESISQEFGYNSNNPVESFGIRKYIYDNIFSNGNSVISLKNTLEQGNIGGLITNDWSYSDDTTRLRTKHGTYLYLCAGDIIHLSDYSIARMLVGYKGDYTKGSMAWLTNDFTATVDGEYVVVMEHVPSETVTVESLGNLLQLITKKLGDAAYKNVDNSPNENSTNPIENGAVVTLVKETSDRIEKEIGSYISTYDNEYWKSLNIDKEGRIYHGVNHDDIEENYLPQKFHDSVEIGSLTSEQKENDDYLLLGVDSNYKIHHALRKNGVHEFPAGIKSPNIIQRNLKGKKISILGDSISTYQGWLADSEYQAWYPHVNAEGGTLNHVEETWWYQVIAETGMVLLKNASWSGSTCCGNASATNTAAAGCSDKRISDLADGNTEPDIIIVYIGTNDFQLNRSLKGWSKDMALPTNESNASNDFSIAYCLMLSKIMNTYKNAKIFCCTLLPKGYVENKTDTPIYPYKNSNDKTLNDYNAKIIEIAESLGISVIRLDLCGINYGNMAEYLIWNIHSDKLLLHPLPSGMKYIADKIYKSL